MGVVIRKHLSGLKNLNNMTLNSCNERHIKYVGFGRRPSVGGRPGARAPCPSR